MLPVDVSLDLGFHVVIGVGRLTVQQEGFIRQLHFTTHTQFQVQSSFLLDVVVRLCPVIVNSICFPNSCIFHIAKTDLLVCFLYKPSSLYRLQPKWLNPAATHDVCVVLVSLQTCAALRLFRSLLPSQLLCRGLLQLHHIFQILWEKILLRSPGCRTR